VWEGSGSRTAKSPEGARRKLFSHSWNPIWPHVKHALGIPRKMKVGNLLDLGDNPNKEGRCY